MEAEDAVDGELAARALTVLVEEAWKRKAASPLLDQELTSSQLLYAWRGGPALHPARPPGLRSLFSSLARRAVAALLCRPLRSDVVALDDDAFSLSGSWSSDSFTAQFRGKLCVLQAEARARAGSHIAPRLRFSSCSPARGRMAAARRTR